MEKLLCINIKPELWNNIKTSMFGGTFTLFEENLLILYNMHKIKNKRYDYILYSFPTSLSHYEKEHMKQMNCYDSLFSFIPHNDGTFSIYVSMNYINYIDEQLSSNEQDYEDISFLFHRTELFDIGDIF